MPLALAQPSKQYRPAGHGLQLDVRPDPSVEKLPAGQLPLPMEDAQPSRQYFPAGHGKQLSDVPVPATEKLPAGQIPEPTALLQPSRQNLPAGHGEQNADPFNAKVPGGHGRQDGFNPSPIEAYDPDGHWPNSADDVFAKQYFPAGQGTQFEDTPSPKSEYVPALQVPMPEAMVDPSRQ